MTDATINRIVARGTTAQRTAFVPSPATPASGPAQGYLWWDTDLQEEFAYDFGLAAWVSTAGAGLTVATTTDVLTGTDNTKYVSSDALAALWEKGGDITSAGTISVGEGGFFHVTGTVTITDIDFAVTAAGRTVVLEFDAALTLTHNATTLILPTGANIVTAAGDVAGFVSEGGDNVRCTFYQRKDGTALVGGSSGALVLIASANPSGTGTVTFSAIPGTYSALKIIGAARSTKAGTGAVNLNMQFNSDAGANYAYQYSYSNSNSGSVGNGQATGQTATRCVELSTAGDVANYPSVFEITIPFYANTTFAKECIGHYSVCTNTTIASLFSITEILSWSGTAAITQIDLVCASDNFVTGSQINLYGVI
jgi:hypothetical protein